MTSVVRYLTILTSLIAHQPRPPMHADTLFDVDLHRHTYCPFGIGVLQMHMPSRLVRADRDRRKIHRAKYTAYCGEQGRGIPVVSDPRQLNRFFGLPGITKVHERSRWG